MGLIDVLEIGSFNSLYSLANVIKEELGTFLDEFPEALKEILGFGSLVNGDVSEVFNIPKIIERIEAKIEQMSEKRVSKIMAKVDETGQ